MAALPLRARESLGHAGRVTGASVRWLATSREHTNFTYDLSPTNLEHLAWLVDTVTGCGVADARAWIDEASTDVELGAHVVAWTHQAKRAGISDPVARWGRRLGWYALVRATRPNLIVETGTDKGLGTCLLAAALRRNGAGSLITVDVNPESGFLVQPPYAAVVERRIGDSIEILHDLDTTVDMFIHDSLHTDEHERAELAALDGRFTDRSLVLSDNAHVTTALSEWAEINGRHFLYFAERPIDHWYPGEGFGIAWM
jgi:hypothetical protein